MKVLMTRPSYDDATWYIFNWSIPIINEIKNKNYKLFDLKRKRANRENVISFLEKQNPRFLILNGHGTEDSIFGQDNKVLITKGDEILMINKLIYTIACEAAKSLGKSIINKGGECFIGYENKFVFLIDQNKSATPLKDEKAKEFFECTNKIPLSLIKGNTSKQAFEKAQEEFKRRIIKWRTSEEIEAPHILRALLWDFISLRLIGNENSKL